MRMLFHRLAFWVIHFAKSTTTFAIFKKPTKFRRRRNRCIADLGSFVHLSILTQDAWPPIRLGTIIFDYSLMKPPVSISRFSQSGYNAHEYPIIRLEFHRTRSANNRDNGALRCKTVCFCHPGERYMTHYRPNARRLLCLTMSFQKTH